MPKPVADPGPIPAALADVDPFPIEAVDTLAALDPVIATALATDLADLPEPEEGGPDLDALVPVARWRIGSEGEAEWAMRHLAAAEGTVADRKAQAAAWRAPIDEWERSAVAEAEGRARFFRGHLEDFMRRERTDRRKSIPLPSGRIESRGATEPKVIVVDEPAVIEWAEESLGADVVGAVVKTTQSVLLTGLREEAKITEQLVDASDPDGETKRVVVSTTTGEPVPGVAIEDPTITYAAKPTT